MKAILIKELGNADQMRIGEVLAPKPADDELLVKVKAAALNRADILQRQGHYPPPPGASPILGLDMAGIVEQVGIKCTGWKPGDRVCGLLSGGGYAEYAVINAKMAMPVPENLSFEAAASIPEAFLTAYQALFWLGDLQPKENILIHAGASGVGTAAIQLVKEAGANAMVTAGSERKLDACRQLGATTAINYKESPFAPKVLAATENRGVDLILDFVGAPYWEQNYTALAPDGRLIFLATMGGSELAHFSLSSLMRKRIKLIGSTLRVRSLDYKIRLTQDFAQFALPRFADGRLKAVVDKTFPWEEVAKAHGYMEENLNIGKIVLKISN
jgi:putative PIG3 family NAD(P)H quinone oxidoreductase